MIKLLGAVLIITGTAAWGAGRALRLKNRVRSLSSLVTALGMMGSEIEARMTPMPELLDLLENEAPYPSKRLFAATSENMKELGMTPFSGIWEQAVRETPELLLSAREESCLKELGFSLGRYDIAQVRAAIGYTIRRLSDYRDDAERERKASSKMYAFLGVAAGVFAVVVLI